MPVRMKSPSKRILPDMVNSVTLVSPGCKTWALPLTEFKSSLPAHCVQTSDPPVVRTTGGSLVCTQCAGKLDFNSVSGNAQVLQPGLTNVTLFTMSGNILFDGDFIRTGIYTMKSGKGTVEVHFSGNDSFDLKAQTSTGTVDNQAEAYLKPDSHGVRHIASKFTKGLFGTVGGGLAKVGLSSYSR